MFKKFYISYVNNKHKITLLVCMFCFFLGWINCTSRRTTEPPQNLKSPEENKTDTTNFPIVDLNSKVDVAILDKQFEQADFMKFEYTSKIVFKFKFINKTDKDIKGVEGRTIFYDLFGHEIYSTRLSYDEGILKMSSKVYNAFIEYNEFSKDLQKLRSVSLKNLKYKWEVETIIYEDGTSERK